MSTDLKEDFVVNGISEFWRFLLERLPGYSRRCEKCRERMWLGYSDGHIWGICLNCPPVFSLDPAGYVTSYPVPTTPMPACIEAKRDETAQPFTLPHEQFYRLKCVCGISPCLCGFIDDD